MINIYTINNTLNIDEDKKNLFIFFTLSPNSVRMLSSQAYVFHNYAKTYNLIYISLGTSKSSMKYFLEDAKIPFSSNTIYLSKEIKNIYDTAKEKTNEEHAQNSIINKIDIKPDVILNWGNITN